MPKSLVQMPAGRRVAYWRSRRGLSQQMLADRLGKSKSWVDKIERGVRALDKFSVLREIAEVLNVEVDHLLGKGAARKVDPDNAIESSEADDIRAALTRYVSVTGYLGGTLSSPALPELNTMVGHAWLTYQHGGYDKLARTLPGLLRDAQCADAHHRSGDDARTAAHLLAQLYQVASSLLRKTGDHELAWLAADRATTVSIRADDPLLTGIAASRAGNALLALGRPRSALELHLAVAHQLCPTGADSDTPQRLSVYGNLLLQAAMAAARLGDGATVADLLREAERAARALGTDQNHYWTSFGQTNVTLHRVAADVELGEGNRAVENHLRLDPDKLAALMPERRAQHLLDVARAYVQIGKLAEASRTLLAGERLAPAEIRDRPAAHALVNDLVRRTSGKPYEPIVGLAERLGIQPI